ncbi:alpha/beta family hydrolase [Ferrimonas balearica]|uniref:alpha/beta family hydrolase n=1 Tax=Ferrimonas balearica TaxID=44012 RepID=UPI001C994022|nr:alpha/beta family hydrolase [Ferrimonas balearica]MBY5992752.1 alpha/beta hydrolase [Ferrimonas balearica]
MILSPLPIDDFPAEHRLDGNPDAPNLVLLAHGAGAGMDHPFMVQFAQLLAGDDIAVIRFEFPYMIRARAEERRRPPDRLPKLTECYQGWIDALSGSGRRLYLAGKSMGGRVATVCGAEAEAAGVIALGYPFHPVGKSEPEKWRWAPVLACTRPLLILQGERDTFGSRAELAAHRLPEGARLHYLTDGDHSFKPRKLSGLTEHDNLARAAELARAFIQGHAS